MRSRFSILAITAKWRRNSAAAMIALVVSIVTSAASAFPDYPQRDSTQFLGSAAQFEGNSVPITQGTGGTGDPSGWTTNNGILSIGNTSSVSETWFTIPGFTPNPNNGYTVEMRFKVTDAGTKYVGEFNPQGSTPGSLFSFAIKGDGIYDTLRTPNVPLYSGDLTDEFHTIRVAVAGNLDTINGPGNHAYMYIDGTPVGGDWTSADPYAHTYGGPTRLLFGDTGGGIVDGAIQVDYLRADTTGSYAPLAPPIVVDMNGGKSFNRAILGQNGFANPYISEDREAGYAKVVELFDRTSVRGIAGGSAADSYNWKTRVDEFQTFVRPDGQRALGQSTLEMLRHARDKNSEVIITVNETGIGIFNENGDFQFTSTSTSSVASLAKDWVRYTNHILQTYRQGDVITDPEDLRILNEISWNGPDFNTDTLLAPGEAALPTVTYWEIGNEVDDNGTPATYRSRYRSIVQAMRQSDNSIKVGPSVIGAASASLSGAKLDRLLRFEIGPGWEQVDFVSYHPYNYQTLALDGSDHQAISEALNSMKANQVDERNWIRNRIANSGRNANQMELLTTEWNPASWEGYSWHRRQYNALGVIETAFTFAELDMRAANFWVWPADINTGTETCQYLALKALVDYAGDTLVASYQEENIRIYVTRDSATEQVVVWGMNFAYGDATDPTEFVQLSLSNLGIENARVTMKRLADLNQRTTLFSRAEGTAEESVGWIDSDLTGQIDLSNFLFALQPAELTMLVIQQRLPGDFNADGIVDAADYVVWRKTLGTNFALNGNGENTGGSANVVDQADYVLWQKQYGDALEPLGEGVNAIPEPGTSFTMMLGIFIYSCYLKRARDFFE
jgi:hypothetical protein